MWNKTRAYKSAFIFLLGSNIYCSSFAQTSVSYAPVWSHPVDSAILYKSRKAGVLTGNLLVYGGTMVAPYTTWYKNYPQSQFHFFNDNKEWLQVDKVGHAWTAYNEGRANMRLWAWAGMPRRKAIWIGGLSGLAYQSIIETLDGFSAEWGFSWGDYVGNLAGSALLIGQEFAWQEQRIQFKFSSHRNTYNDPVLRKRTNDLYGKNLPERLLKDYNAQTYWLSINIRSFFKTSSLPPWLNLAIVMALMGCTVP